MALSDAVLVIAGDLKFAAEHCEDAKGLYELALHTAERLWQVVVNDVVRQEEEKRGTE